MTPRKQSVVILSWLILVFGIIYVNYASGVDQVRIKKPLLYFPFEIGEWRDKETKESEYFETEVGADDVTIREYADNDGHKMGLYMAYFNYIKEGKGPHAPQLCWVGGGWAFKDMGDERFDIGRGDRAMAVVKKLLAEKGSEKIILFYCYKIDKEYVADFSRFRMLCVFDSIIKRRNNSFTLQLTSDVKPDGVTVAVKKMKDFLAKVFPLLESEFLP